MNGAGGMSDMIPTIPRSSILIAVVLAVLFTVTLVIRGLPLLLLGEGDVLNMVAMDDPMYNLRMVEWMISSGSFSFPLFDAMTFYPYGQVMPWGPVFTWITVLFPLAVGASTQSEIVYASLWVPPVLSALMIPVIYLLGKAVWNWKAGIAAAVFMAFIGGQFFSRSLAGYLDHHVAEVLFGALFALFYIYAIREFRNDKKREIDPVYMQICKNRETSPLYFGLWKTGSTPYKNDFKPYMFAILAGITYVAGFLNMPTMILFAVVALITTTILAIYEFAYDRDAMYLLWINGIVFGIAAVFSLMYTYVPAIYGLTGYTVFHPLMYVLIITWTAILIFLQKIVPGHTTTGYVTAIAGVVVGSVVGLFLIAPGTAGTLMNGVMSFFGFNQVMTTIQEARPWTFAEAWGVYNFGFVMMVAGFIVLMFRTWKEKVAENIFVLVWSVFIIVATFRQVRYEYYLAVNVALLAGVCIAYFLETAWPAFLKSRAPEKTGKKTTSSRRVPGAVAVAAVILMFAVAFVGTSVMSEISAGTGGVFRMNPEWRGALDWMNENTPATGIDPTAVYDQAGFTYPDEAYSVMSWWDYGHMITYFANRIPVANPFQVGVAGKYGAASFFMTDDETELDRIAEFLDVRYVITDIEMATGKFWAMATWDNATLGASPYQRILLVPAPSGVQDQYAPATVYTDEYFTTTIARLHFFDGAMVPAGDVYYVETITTPEAPYPVVTRTEIMTHTDAKDAAMQYNRQAPAGRSALVIGPTPISPTRDVPALHRFRLVHESPGRYVKVFEYVPGARIPGDGVIEHLVTTNTGRQFVWRAESVDGVFTVPYPGQYTVVGTGQVVDVTEAEVMNG